MLTISALVAAIIADDLTGALDAAAPFAALGWSTVVATSPSALEDALRAGSEVVAVSLNSREIGSDEARALAARAARTLDNARIRLKKIDSRLKGNIAAEVQGVESGWRPTRFAVSPAIPGMQRRVVAGRLEGWGVPDPIDVRPVMSAGASVPLDIPDIETDADLDRLVAGAASDTVFVGARGLAAALARSLDKTRSPATRTMRLVAPMAIIVGSRDPITLEQVSVVVNEGKVPVVKAPAGVLPATGSAPALVVLAREGVSPAKNGAAVTLALAEGILRNGLGQRGTLVLTGGETAAAVLAALGADVLDVLGEVLPGLPVCRRAGAGHGPLFVTKSGGFGGPRTLLDLVSETREAV